jgi:hypothetical protein
MSYACCAFAMEDADDASDGQLSLPIVIFTMTPLLPPDAAADMPLSRCHY